MKVAIVSTYPPRACGIATYSADLRQSLLRSGTADEVDVVSIVREKPEVSSPEVVFSIRQDVRADYIEGALLLNRLSYDVVLIQHEYGIFGGDLPFIGNYIIDLAESVDAPIVVTLHTVLAEPNRAQSQALRTLCNRANVVHVMTNTAERFVMHNNLAKPHKIRVVAHGAPDVLITDRINKVDAKANIGIKEDRFVFGSFGLISSNKNMQLAISAMDIVRRSHPEALLLIAGQTHPEIVKADGESYRESLTRQIDELAVNENVVFINRYLTLDDLQNVLSATDVYVTPYSNKEQIVSGALTFAIAAGLPTISTPYYYAEDLLASGAGILVPFRDELALAKAMERCMDRPEMLESLRAEADSVSHDLAWTAVGAAIGDLIKEAVEAQRRKVHLSELLGSTFADRPTVRLTHLHTLIDDVGIIQHATGAIPNRSTGYCVDDVGRLAGLAQRLCNHLRVLGTTQQPSLDYWSRVRTQCVAYMLDAASGSKGMRNFAKFGGAFLDEPHQGDHVGRAVWGLGIVCATDPDESVWLPAQEVIRACVGASAKRRKWVRPDVYSLLGLVEIPNERDLPEFGRARSRAKNHLVDLYQQNSSEDWVWFEDHLSYDNARLCEALLRVGARDGDTHAMDIALNTLSWLWKLVYQEGGFIRVPGNKMYKTGDDLHDTGDEQPLDIAAIAEAMAAAYEVTRQDHYAERAITALSWFLGNNRLAQPVGILGSGACQDGLEDAKVNLNQGAESTLAFISTIVVLEDCGVAPPVSIAIEPRSLKLSAAATI